MDQEYLKSLLRELINLPNETEWFELKRNNADPEEIGKNVSAISNACALYGKSRGYMLWGLDDQSHAVIGTKFQPRRAKIGNQELESWLLMLLEPRINLQIKEREIWRTFDRISFEQGIAKENIGADEILSLIDYPNYFQLLQQPLPDNRIGILERLTSEAVIRLAKGDRYDITNVGAVLFAKNLDAFDSLGTKAIRIIVYDGDNRIKTIKEHRSTKGYAVGFKEVIEYINDQLPRNEEIGQAFRRDVRMYPEIAIRELVANM